MVRDLTQGKPFSVILRFCLPLMAGNMFQQFYNLVDSVIVGRFVGKEALSAIGCVGSLNFLVVTSVIGLCTGFAIPVAQCFGAGDYTKMRKYIANIIYVCIAVTAVITTVVYLNSENLLIILNTPEDILPDADTYISIIFLGLPATVLYNTLASVIRSIGDSKTPLYFLVLSCVINIALDLLFVIKFSMGVKGVAIATVIAQAISGLCLLLYIKKNIHILHLCREEMGVDWSCIKKLFYAGLPMSLQFSITAVGSVLLQSCVNELGSDVIAAVTIAGKTQLILVLPSETIGLTLATYSGQNLGAQRLDRIKKGVNQSLIMALVYSVIAAFIAGFLGDKISLLFIEGSETAVLGLVDKFLSTCAVFYPILVLIFVYRNTLQGLGFSIPAMGAGVLELFARSIMGFAFVRSFGYTAVCFANPVAWFAADILLVPMYFIVMHKFKTNADYLKLRTAKSFE